MNGCRDVGCLHSASLSLFAVAVTSFIRPGVPDIFRTLRGELVHSAKDDQGKQPQPQPEQGSDKKPRPNADVGDVLRRAYDETLNESVPDDLLDLLKKLD